MQEQLFNTIVNTLLSTKEVEPSVIQAHVKQYAQVAGVPYELAKQAVILKARDLLLKKTALI